MAAGDKVYWSDIDDIIAAPVGRLVQAVAQSIPDAVATALTWTTEDFDTHGFHDPTANNTRISPTVDGYYDFRAVYYTGAPTTLVTLDVHFRKNGAGSIASGLRGNAGSIAQSVSAFCLQPMSVGDYMDVMAFQDSAGAVNSNVSSRFTSFVEWRFVRPL